jgi:hypothetical protein
VVRWRGHAVAAFVDALIDELRRGSGADVSADVPAEYTTDFGQLLRRVPRALVRARCEDEVVHTLRTSRRLGVPVTVRGAGHSCFGQTVTDGVLLINDHRGSAGPRLLEDGLVEVPARSRWRDVEAYLNARGRSVPVLADYLDLSVGGTLSVGGYGADSVVRGVQVDHVERIRLITPDGEARWCSAREHAELFSYALAGLGQVGVIEKAVVRTVPYRPLTTIFTYRHRSLGELVDSLEWLSGSSIDDPLMFKALHSRGRYVATYGVQVGSARDAMAAMRRPPVPSLRPNRTWITPRYRQWRSLVVRLWVSQFSEHGRMWTDFLFDYAGLRSFVGFLEPMLQQGALATCLKSVYVMAIRRLPREAGFPLEASEATDAPMSFGIGLYSMIPGREPALTSSVADAMSACLDECMKLGGRPYRYGWQRMTEAHHRAFYGSAYDRLLELRRELDPDGLFQASFSPSGGLASHVEG